MQAEEKKKIRKGVLAIRDALPRQLREAMSITIGKNFAALDEVVKSSAIMIFLSFGSEVRTDYIVEWLWQQKKKALAPLCRPGTREMAVYAINTFADVAPGYFGIREPKRDVLKPFTKKEIDLVAVPAVAFDGRGHRVGYGGGYYDRFLADMDVPKIGLAFSCQLVPEVPSDSFDQPVQGIVTEKGYMAISQHLGYKKPGG